MKAPEALPAPQELNMDSSSGGAHSSYQQITGWQVGHQHFRLRQACHGL